MNPAVTPATIPDPAVPAARCRPGTRRRSGTAGAETATNRYRCPTARALAAGAPCPASLPGADTGPEPATHRYDPETDTAPIRCADRSGDEYGRPLLGPARLDEPGDLIAAIPAMLGFQPERSLVLAVLCAAPGAANSALIDLVVRFDLQHPSTAYPGDSATVAAAAARVCARPGVVGVLAVLVDDELREPDTAVAPRAPVLRELERRLAARAVPIRGAWAVRAIVAGQPWWSLTVPARRGSIADPVASAVTLGRVLDGRPIRHSREELTALIAVEEALRDRVAEELDEARIRAKDRYAAAARRDDPTGFLRGELMTVLWLIANTESGAELGPRELADITVALRDRVVRDAMFALADTVHAEAAESLWGRLTRALDGVDRAETAMLLGYFAYVRGDGPLAGIALDAALAADPRHSMAELLHTALEAGMRPRRLRDLARCGRETAADLGIDLDADR